MSDLAAMLRPAPADDSTAPGAPAPDPDMPGLALALPGAQVSIPEQARAALWQAARAARFRAREMSRREGGLVNGLLTGKPPSVHEECEYAKSRAWVPAGHEGGLAEKLGTLHHALVGRPGVTLGNWISATAHKPMRFYITLFLVIVIVLVIAFA